MPWEDESFFYFCRDEECLNRDLDEHGLLRNKEMEADLYKRGYRPTRQAYEADTEKFPSLTNGPYVFKLEFLETWRPVFTWDQGLPQLPPLRHHFNDWNTLVDQSIFYNYAQYEDPESMKKKDYFLASKRKPSDGIDEWTMHFDDHVPAGIHYSSLW